MANVLRDHQANLPESAFAFPGKRKEPMTDASHVRNAIARFDQVKDATDQEREEAFANLKAAARHFNVKMTETSWDQLGKKPHTANPAKKTSAKSASRKAAAKKASAKKSSAKKSAKKAVKKIP